MRTIPKAILDRLHSDAIAEAFVVLLDFGLTTDEHVRLARYPSDVTYGGHTYTGWPCSGQILAGQRQQGVPTVELVLPDAVEVLRPYALATTWFRGCTLTMMVVCVGELGVDYTWSTLVYNILEAAPHGQDLSLRLGGRNLTKQRFPADRYWADQCPYARGFGDDPRCGYDTTAPGAYTTCAGTLADCVLRSRQTSFGGFLGLDPDAAHLVLPANWRGVI